MINNIRAIIFDLDDTLFDRNSAQIQTVKLIMQNFPRIFQGIKEESIVEAFLESDRLVTIDFDAGAPSEGLRDKRTRWFLQLLDIKKEEYAPAITEMYVRDYPKINIPIPGAVPVVKSLSKKFSLAVITNGLPDVQYRKIEAIGLGGVFSAIVLSEEIGIRKPDPRIFQQAAETLHAPPAACLYVGDSYRNDIVGAKAAGMQACWYNPQSLRPEATDVQPDYEISKIGELAELLGE